MSIGTTVQNRNTQTPATRLPKPATNMRWLLSTMIWATCTSTGHATDLLDTYRQGLANDPVLSQAGADRRVVGESVVQRRATLLPQAVTSLNTNEGQAAGSDLKLIRDRTTREVIGSTDGHTRSRELQGQIKQTIFDPARIAGLQAAHSQLDAQDAMYEAALQALATRVTTAYFNALTSDDALTFANANEQALARQLEQASLRFEVGLSAITDVQDAKAQHDTAVAQVITAQNTLADAREALTQITGAPADNLRKLREDLPMDPPSPNDARAWVDTAVQTSPAIAAARFTVESAGYGIAAARSDHLPTLEASASYGKDTTWFEKQSGVGNPPLNNGRGQSKVGLALDLPIYSGGATQSRVRQSRYQRNATQHSLEATRRGVVRDTLNYFRSAVAGIDKVRATRAAVMSAQSAREATQAGVDVGSRTMVDLLIAQQNLARAQREHSLARHQFILDSLLLKQTAGNIDVRDLEAANALLQQRST
jgi:outer membrane protein